MGNVMHINGHNQPSLIPRNISIISKGIIIINFRRSKFSYLIKFH